MAAAGIPVVIIASTGIGIENFDIWSDVANAIDVDVSVASSVTVERSLLGTTWGGEPIYLGPGSTGLIADDVIAEGGTGIEDDETSAGSEIVSNTLNGVRGAGIEVTGAGAQADILVSRHGVVRTGFALESRPYVRRGTRISDRIRVRWHTHYRARGPWRRRRCMARHESAATRTGARTRPASVVTGRDGGREMLSDRLGTERAHGAPMRSAGGRFIRR